MLKASEAKQASKKYYNKLVSDHEVEYAQIMERERKQTARIWALRGEAFAEKIEGWIRKAAKAGRHSTYEPSDINVHGDEVIWLKKEDQPIHDKLMDYFRQNGFKVTEFSPLGMKIEW
jgi:hypothetical protein